MRLSVNLDQELYAAAKNLARARDCSISSAINELIRRGLEPKGITAPRGRGGLPIVRCVRTFTSEDVYAIDSESG